MKEKFIKIDSFNPYESRFPNRKLITRDTLILVKELRSQGYKIVIEPEDDRPIEYLYKKGLTQLFADPINVILIGIPISIVTNIISNKIQKLIDGEEKIDKSNINIKIDNSNNVYNYLGEPQDKDNVKSIIKRRKEDKEGFNKRFEIKSPRGDYPIPIFLEHKPRIVGWCKLWSDEIGLKSEGFITDKIVKRRISQNRLNGASVTGIATKAECSICSLNYVECNHIAGEKYNNNICSNFIIKTDFVETSIVKTPINSQCLLGWK